MARYVEDGSLTVSALVTVTLGVTDAPDVKVPYTTRVIAPDAARVQFGYEAGAVGGRWVAHQVSVSGPLVLGQGTGGRRGLSTRTRRDVEWYQPEQRMGSDYAPAWVLDLIESVRPDSSFTPPRVASTGGVS